jgi:hypothetical protein
VWFGGAGYRVTLSVSFTEYEKQSDETSGYDP